ncbi:hypothetical protein PGN35_010355 [Nodosilinea sp. PGN35]|uniref:hypothetical protein n=1 Tax=Nodosilinea sp. PGN35 TaxID=3020489 RepID=UPI0023B310A2|nr:hypothetical protein [Nodosilinea sp. TSF1-S3]MDF0366570.1 hypothetical protein [Nodosilinea sp. TSF1-S3]
MFQHYRYISGRTLLGLPKLDRCQSLPSNTWTAAEHLWHVVFISHRWGNQADPDPAGSQLAALQKLLQRMVEIAEVISNERVGREGAKERLARLPSLNQQGTLQAAHLVFRSLAAAESIPEADEIWSHGRAIVDVIGFWYDYSCLPQDPRNPAEDQEFAQTLQGIGEMILSPQVSTLVLRKEGDGYLSRGWCFAESMIAQSKSDPYMPMVLRTDRWGEPVSVFNSGAFAAYKPLVEQAMALWESPASTMSAWELFSAVIQATALPLLLKSESSTSEFALALSDTITPGTRVLAQIQTCLVMVQEGEPLDLAVPLASLLQGQGLGCREQRDYILVALLLLKSITSEDAVGEMRIWREALVRFTEGLPLEVVRRDGELVWQS